MTQLPFSKAEPPQRFTYADYLTWGEDVRCELIDGVVYDMNPSPLERHQLVLGELFIQIASFLRGSPSKVIAAPYDVRFPKRIDQLDEDDIETVVPPDISVVCDPAKRTRRGCIGPPDIVVEILSQHTAGKDQTVKRELYESNGVREFWIINPWENFVAVLVLDENGKYPDATLLRKGDKLTTPILPGLEIDLAMVLA